MNNKIQYPKDSRVADMSKKQFLSFLIDLLLWNDGFY
jgi:hypothetical protein